MTDPPFAAPWHARAFALTHHLADRGVFGWDAWTDALAAEIAARDIVTADDHYRAWLAALERLVDDPGRLARLRGAWARAHRDTPHGQPVSLPSSFDKHSEEREGLAPRSGDR